MASEIKSRVMVYLSPDMKFRGERKAKELGISLSGLMAISLNEYLKQDSVTEFSQFIKEFKNNQNVE